MAKRKQQKPNQLVNVGDDYDSFLSGLSALLDQSRRSVARAVNAVLATTYWEVGRRIVTFEQGGQEKAGYGEAVIDRLAADLTRAFGRGFSRSNLFQIRSFYLGWEIVQTPSGLLQLLSKPTAEGGSEAVATAGSRPPPPGASSTGVA